MNSVTAGSEHKRMFFSTGRARTRCPHCHCAANCRSSREITVTHRELYYECTNLFCGHAWHASESYDYGLRPSVIPDPRVDLPMRVPNRQEVIELMRPVDAQQPDMFGDAGAGMFEPPG